MAVPKKRTSKSKTKSRQSYWRKKAYFQAQRALSLAKSSLTGKSKSFLFPTFPDLQSEDFKSYLME
uniref:ribosomal protein L32 n=1 Tax=Chroodactylon ornatum TaxID=139907 RepID=UPI001FCD8637|nr:ribosomal protein L32 [Chroodactylon ornatum]UNJ14549.1 ribosomal protein L32 [Chroodactylon ornatum]